MAGTTLPGYATLLDIAKRNYSDQVVGLIDEASRLVPEVRLFPSRPIPGTSYKTWVRTSVPRGGFRDANTGAVLVKSTYENRDISTYIFNPRFEVDVAVADRDIYGAADYLANESTGMLEGGFQTLGRCFFYGRNQFSVASSTAISVNGVPNDQNGWAGPDLVTVGNQLYGGDLKGCPGLIDGFNNAYQVDAAGTTANTGASAWGVKRGTQFVNWVYGENGQFNVRDVRIERVLDSNSQPLSAYTQEIMAYPGLQIGDLRGVCRIKNLTADSGKGLTDALLGKVIALLPAGIMPDLWLMNRRSWEQLRASRTATNVTGEPAPLPTEYQGIPIMITDSLSDYEPINWLGI